MAGAPPPYSAYPPPQQGSGGPQNPPYNPGYPQAGYPPEAGKMPQPPAGYPAQPGGYAPPQQPTVAYPSSPPQAQQQTIVVTSAPVYTGNCPVCRAGYMTENFTCCGICLAIFCFPLGLLCCFLMRERRCSRCGATV